MRVIEDNTTLKLLRNGLITLDSMRVIEDNTTLKPYALVGCIW